MALALRTNESPARGLVRVMDGQVARLRALGQGEAVDIDGYVRRARVCCKRIRACLRLCRPMIGKEMYVRHDRWWRDAARGLSRLRDLAARSETLAALEPDITSEAGEDMVDAAQVQFAAERLESGAVDAGQAITRFARALELAPRIMRSDLKGANLQDLADALGQTYRKARKAMREAYRTGEIERFHDWRKLAKHHAMQVRITHPLFPYLEMRVQPAAELGELLGRLQDVSVVVEGLRTANGADRRSKTRLCTALDVETERLIEAARAPGQALFGAPRRTFERRLLADLDWA